MKGIRTPTPDVNECEEDNGLCAELCINTAGSYMCDCPIGLVLDEHDRKTCRGT